MEIDRESREKEIQNRDNVIGRDKGGGGRESKRKGGWIRREGKGRSRSEIM